jgi:hypothetical protein
VIPTTSLRNSSSPGVPWWTPGFTSPVKCSPKGPTPARFPCAIWLRAGPRQPWYWVAKTFGGIPVGGDSTAPAGRREQGLRARRPQASSSRRSSSPSVATLEASNQVTEFVASGSIIAPQLDRGRLYAFRPKSRAMTARSSLRDSAISSPRCRPRLPDRAFSSRIAGQECRLRPRAPGQAPPRR